MLAQVWIWNYNRPPMKSKKNPRSISFSFNNKRAGPVDLSYAAGDGQADTFFSTIEPDTQYSVTTYAGHNWHIRETGQDAVLHTFTIPPKKDGITQLDIE